MPYEYSGIDLSAGDPEERYELLEMVGRGAYGAVWKARDTKMESYVAVKLIPFSVADQGLDEVRREIAILKDCQHPNIVQYHGSYLAETNLWILMEFCGGGSVCDIMSTLEQPLTEPQIAIICRESLKALAYLHQKLRIHRDVKGGNILLTEAGEVKLADFGVSAQLVSTLSRRNTFVGTAYWMAPEVIQERSYDGRADIWSLGITCIEMAELNPPLINQHPFQVLFRIPKDSPPTLCQPELWSSDFQDFLSACLIKDIEKRPQATMMMKHPFVEQALSTAVLVPLIHEWKDKLASLKEDSKRRRGKTSQPASDSESETAPGTTPRPPRPRGVATGRRGPGPLGTGGSASRARDSDGSGEEGSEGGTMVVHDTEAGDDDGEDASCVGQSRAEVEEGEEDGTFVQREGSDSGEEGSMIVLSDGDAALESPQAKHATGQRGSFIALPENARKKEPAVQMTPLQRLQTLLDRSDAVPLPFLSLDGLPISAVCEPLGAAFGPSAAATTAPCSNPILLDGRCLPRLLSLSRDGHLPPPGDPLPDPGGPDILLPSLWNFLKCREYHAALCADDSLATLSKKEWRATHLRSAQLTAALCVVARCDAALAPGTT